MGSKSLFQHLGQSICKFWRGAGLSACAVALFWLEKGNGVIIPTMWPSSDRLLL